MGKNRKSTWRKIICVREKKPFLKTVINIRKIRYLLYPPKMNVEVLLKIKCREQNKERHKKVLVNLKCDPRLK